MAIMRKERDEATMPGQTTPAGPPHTILGPEANFDGTLTFEGRVRIEGQFSGKIQTNDVVEIGKDAKVTATV